MISVIIPHKNRNGILKETLYHLDKKQTCRRDLFEIIVVDDGSETLPEAVEWGADSILHNEGVGPGEARNTGAMAAKFGTVLFVGNDTIPDRNLVFRHIYQHDLANNSKITVQGLTPFYPSCMDTEFMHFLDRSGLQANWNGLRNEDGSWKSNANGYLLTTNWSISRDELLLVGGFHPSLKEAAWDDVELGMRLNKLGFATIFDPLAINFHHHRYTLEQFARRQFMEGRNRIYFAMLHPEVSANMINPDELRQAQQIDLEEQLHIANGLGKLSQREIPQATEMKYNAWQSVLRLASVKGILDSVEGNNLRQILLHIKPGEQVTYAVSGIHAAESENWGYASHCVEWLLNSEQSWYTWAFAAEIAKLEGDRDLALIRYGRSLDLQPSDWARNGLDELTKQN